jgi:hypothetical protein
MRLDFYCWGGCDWASTAAGQGGCDWTSTAAGQGGCDWTSTAGCDWTSTAGADAIGLLLLTRTSSVSSSAASDPGRGKNGRPGPTSERGLGLGRRVLEGQLEGYGATPGGGAGERLSESAIIMMDLESHGRACLLRVGDSEAQLGGADMPTRSDGGPCWMAGATPLCVYLCCLPSSNRCRLLANGCG